MQQAMFFPRKLNEIYPGLKSRYRYHIGLWLLVSISPISGINIANIGHIDIGPNIGRFYRVNSVSDTSKSDMILPICIGILWYLKPWILYSITIISTRKMMYVQADIGQCLFQWSLMAFYTQSFPQEKWCTCRQIRAL